MKNIYLVLFIFATTIFSACEKDVLDKGPFDVVDENLIWTDPNTAQLYVNDLYNHIPSRAWGIFDNYDNASDITEGGHSWMGCYTYNFGEVTSANNPFDCWGVYGSIRSANLFLDHADQLEGDMDLINTEKGEAIFLRAYYYFYLVRAYGGVPLITKAQNLTDSLSVSRNTYDECVTFISDEMDKAAALLPSSWDAINVGRATKGAAMALKARILLYGASLLNNPDNNLAKWQKAANAAKAVIDLETYSLYPDYAKLFLDDNNQEVIFDEQWAYPYRINGDPTEIISYEYTINPQGLNGAFGMNRPTQEYVDMFEMANGKAITDPSSGYDPNNPYVGRDPRFYASVFYNGVLWRGDTVQTYQDGKNGAGLYDLYETGTSMTGYYSRKFTDPSIPCVYLVDQVKANWILIRYAEILLDYAEAQIALGNEDEARTYINMVRDRVGMPPTEATGADLVSLYRNERTIELAGEEHRFFDVRRWKIADVALNHPVHKMTITKNEDGTFSYLVEEMERRSFPARMYWQPIPLDEMRKNKYLVQNQEY